MRSMRVTVCFGQTRVIVPCKGGVTVAELVKEACARYKKAIGKSPKYFVKIRQLENAVDGGILDVDDYVYDVAEDRDQLIAVFEEEDNHAANRDGWDRQSGSSSDGRRSPLSSYKRQPLKNRYSNDVNASRGNHAKSPTGKASIIRLNQRDQGLEVDVGIDALKSNTHITVRRGSDPMLNKVENSDNVNEISSSMSQNKSPSNGSQNYYGRRESGSGQEEAEDSKLHQNIMIITASSPEENVSVMTASSDINNSIESDHGDAKPQHTEVNRQYSSGSNFVRGTARQSIMGMLTEKYEADFEQGSDFHTNGLRQPPDGMKRNSSDYEDNFTGSYTSRFSNTRYSPPSAIDKSRFPLFYNDSQEMFIENDGSPLGLQVISYKDEKMFCGLMVKSVDVGGRAEREGLLQKGDIIVEINNYVLAQYSLHVAQDLFKDAMKYPDLQLRVYPVEERERSVVGNGDEAEQDFTERRKLPVLSPAFRKKSNALSSAKSLPDLNSSSATFSSKSVQNATASPNNKQSLIVRMSYDTLSNNTKKIGNMFEIQLRKGEQGLGFSITTRDTAVGDPGLIYIKNILPKGAAIQDGRLQAGDRLLKVNNEEMTGHTQESAVSILRSIPVGSVVDLLISRHVHTLPRKMKDDPVTDKVMSDDNQKEYFMFEIALNDTGSAGLGISLKGNQSKKTRRDLGIFVKSVFHGGAAYQDGRLQPNDQLVSVNGQSLVGMTNHESIDTLRSSMSTVGNVRGMIQMVIARRKHSSREPTSPRFSSEASSDLSDSLINEQNSRHAFEITGPTKEDYYTEQHMQRQGMRYMENMPHQIDPNPVLDNRERYYDDSRNNSENWPPSPGENDIEDAEPFSRESVFRQSISEKRRAGGVSREAYNTDTYKGIKSKQQTAEIDMQKLPEPKKSTPLSSPKWLKPANSKNVRSGNSTPVHSAGTRYSPSANSRNQNNSNSFSTATGNHPQSDRTLRLPSQEYRQSKSSLENRTLNSRSILTHGSMSSLTSSKTSLNSTPPLKALLSPTRYKDNNGTLFSFDHTKVAKAVPIVKKSNSSESLVTIGVYSKKITLPSEDNDKNVMNRDIPYIKPPVFPYSDLKHLAACCAPASMGNLSQREISPSYHRHHPFTAREEQFVRPGIDVGPTLGIAKSSSLESLQTAVENFVDGKKNPDMFPKAKTKVLRGRVLNESFRAALDHSYDLDKVNGKPMATLREEEGSHMSSLVTSSDNAVGNMRQKTHEKKRAGKSYKIFGLFRVKGKRSVSTDRNSGSSVSSASSSPYLPENELHKRHLQSKRQDDYRKHLEETERIQAKAKEMREQQEQRRKQLEKKLSKDIIASENEKIQEERVRAPSVPVTAMQKINIDPKKTYFETPSGRHSVDPLAMRDHQSQLNNQNFEWHSTKKTSDRVKTQPSRGRQKANEKKKIHPLDKDKPVPDYSSLPRQPSFEPKAGLPSNRTPNSVVTQSDRGRERMRSPNPNYSGTLNRTDKSGFNNYQFYNMQKPPSSGRPKSRPSAANQTRIVDPAKNEANNQSSRVTKSKAGRMLYYDDTDSSVSPSSTFRENSRNISEDRYQSNVRPRRKDELFNGFDPSSTENFYREKSPEPPPPSNHVSSKPRHSTAAVVKMRDRRREKQFEEDKQAYRHSVHVDTPATRDYYRIRNPHKVSVPPTFKWRTELQKKTADHSDSDNSYRTASPASSGTIERNRDAFNKVFRPRHNNKNDVERIVVSPPYNL